MPDPRCVNVMVALTLLVSVNRRSNLALTHI
jgi:hypothetical protein